MKVYKNYFPDKGCDVIVGTANHEYKLGTNITYFSLPAAAAKKLKRHHRPNKVACTLQWYEVGDTMGRHIDNIVRSERKSSMSILLTDGFEGGDLMIDGVKANLEKGDAVQFDASAEHWVTEVTKGTRVALAVWGVNED